VILPEKASNKPIKVNLKKEHTYSWCSCGLSMQQPFCDGKHFGTGLKPKLFKPDQTGEFFLCMCKNTQNAPFCDGSHENLKI